MDLNSELSTISMDCVNSELLEEGYHFTHHFKPPSQYLYSKSDRGSCEYDTTGYDVIFTVVEDGKHILAHRQKLASKSNYFAAMFSGYFVEAKTTDIKIHGVCAVALKKIVRFCYTNCIKFKPFDAEEIVAAANLMLFEDIVKEGLCYLKTLIQPQTCLGIYTLAQKHNFDKIADFAMSYTNFYLVQVSKTHQFQYISFEMLLDLIKYLVKYQKQIIDSSREPFYFSAEKIHSPFEVFNAVLKWINFDETLRKSHIFDLLPYMPLAESSMELLKEHFTHLEQLNIKYDREQFNQQFGCEENTLYADTSEFIVFEIRSNTLFVFCQIFFEFRILTDLDNNVDFFGQCLFEDKVIMAGGIQLNLAENCRCWSFSCQDCKNYQPNSRKVAYLSLQNFKLYDLPSMKIARRFPGVAVLDNAIYVCGGDAGTYMKPDILNCVERYDLRNKLWTSEAPMINKRAFFCMGAIGKNRIYAIGGTDSTYNYDFRRINYSELSVEFYDTQRKEWNMIAKLAPNEGRLLQDAHFVFNNILHSFVRDYNHEVNICKYDEYSNSWILVKNTFRVFTKKYPIIHSKGNTFIIASSKTSRGRCFVVLYKIDALARKCNLISATQKNIFLLSKKILARNSILNPEEFGAFSKIVTQK